MMVVVPTAALCWYDQVRRDNANATILSTRVSCRGYWCFFYDFDGSSVYRGAVAPDEVFGLSVVVMHMRMVEVWVMMVVFMALQWVQSHPTHSDDVELCRSAEI